MLDLSKTDDTKENTKEQDIKKEDTKKERKNITESNYYKGFFSNFKSIFIGMIFLQVGVLMSQLLLKKTSIIISVMFIMIPIILLLLAKDEKLANVSEGFVKRIFNLELFLSMLILINQIMISFLQGITSGKVTGAYNIIFLFDLGVIIAFIGLLGQEFYSDFLSNLMEAKFSLGGSSDIEEIHAGDAVLGYVVDDNGNKTNIPVVLPLKDRFLHMLILGPTGCGKTSQSIIPMINRDMKHGTNAPDDMERLGIIALEPKGDLAEKVYAMAKYYGREAVYFNPILPDCPYFNPLYGRESDVVENMATTFNMLNADAPQFFKDMTDGLVRRSVKLLKRLYDNDATLIDLNTLVWDAGGEGRKMVMEFSRMRSPNPDIQKENDELYQWFLHDYYAGMGGGKGAPKTYENCSGVRSQISKLVSNEYLRKVLNPPKGHGSDIDFDDALDRGIVIAISTAQGALRDLGRFLGYFIILQLQASVFRRPGNEFTRRNDMLYIDEFQVYSNPGFADMLTMGRSYRVASHLATQARQQIGMGSGKDGDAFVQLVSTNARNKIIYPGVSSADAKYYSEEFGEKEIVTESKSYSKGRFFSTLSEEKVSTSVKNDKKARFSITDIIYRPFGQVTYCIVKKNSVQYAGVSQIEYIPQELNETLDNMVREFNEEQKRKSDKLEALMNMVEDPNVDLSVGAYLGKYEDSVDIKDPLASYSSSSVSTASPKVDSTPKSFKDFNDDTLVTTKKTNDYNKIKEYKNQSTSDKPDIGRDIILEEMSDDDDIL